MTIIGHFIHENYVLATTKLLSSIQFFTNSLLLWYTLPDMNTYELAIVLDGKATPAKKKAAQATIERMIKTHKGEIKNINDWGVKDLAYPINGASTGQYMIFALNLESSGAKALPQMLKLEEEVIRYLLVKVEQKKKKEK